MDYEIKQTGLGDILEVSMNKGEYIFAEPGAFIASEGEMAVESKLYGGVGNALLRAVGGGESLFINKITAMQDNSKLVLAPPAIGSIAEIKMENNSFLLNDNAYIAHISKENEIQVSSKLGMFNALLSGAGFMFSKVSGTGTAFIWGYGGIVRKDLTEGEVLYLDNGNFLAISENAKIERKIIGKGIMSKMVSGEGVVFKITGPATVYYSISSLNVLVRIITKMLRGR